MDIPGLPANCQLPILSLEDISINGHAIRETIPPVSRDARNGKVRRSEPTEYDSENESALNDIKAALNEISADLDEYRPDAGGEAADECSSKKTLKKVSFATDSNIVAFHSHPPNPWESTPSYTRDDILMAYKLACTKQKVKPLAQVVEQIRFDGSLDGKRYQRLQITNESIDTMQVDAMEEIFKRIQFVELDLVGSLTSSEALCAFCEIVLYYESAIKLNLGTTSCWDLRACQSLQQLVKKSSCLTHLDLSGSFLSDQHVTALGRSFQLARHLRVVKLENCNINERRLMALCNVLKTNDSIEELHLGQNKLAPTDGAHLGTMLKQNRTLRVLSLRGNHLQDDGLYHLCEGLKEQNQGDYLSVAPGIINLNLSDNSITHTNMASLSAVLANARSLKILDLSNNPLTNEALFLCKPGLLVNRSLTRLSLRNCKIQNEGAVALAEWLAETRSLEYLDLRNNHIVTAGLIGLVKALPVNKVIQQLILDDEIKKEPGVRDYTENQRWCHEEIKKCLESNRQMAFERVRLEQHEMAVGLPDSNSWTGGDTGGDEVESSASLAAEQQAASTTEATGSHHCDVLPSAQLLHPYSLLCQPSSQSPLPGYPAPYHHYPPEAPPPTQSDSLSPPLTVPPIPSPPPNLPPFGPTPSASMPARKRHKKFVICKVTNEELLRTSLNLSSSEPELSLNCTGKSGDKLSAVAGGCSNGDADNEAHSASSAGGILSCRPTSYSLSALPDRSLGLNDEQVQAIYDTMLAEHKAASKCTSPPDAPSDSLNTAQRQMPPANAPVGTAACTGDDVFQPAADQTEAASSSSFVSVDPQHHSGSVLLMASNCSAATSGMCPLVTDHVSLGEHDIPSTTSQNSCSASGTATETPIGDEAVVLQDEALSTPTSTAVRSNEDEAIVRSLESRPVHLLLADGAEGTFVERAANESASNSFDTANTWTCASTEVNEQADEEPPRLEARSVTSQNKVLSDEPTTGLEAQQCWSDALSVAVGNSAEAHDRGADGSAAAHNGNEADVDGACGGKATGVVDKSESLTDAAPVATGHCETAASDAFAVLPSSDSIALNGFNDCQPDMEPCATSLA